MLKNSNLIMTQISKIVQKGTAGFAILCLLSACSVSEPSKGPQLSPSEPVTETPEPTTPPIALPFPIPDLSQIKIPMPRPLVPLTITAPVDRAPANTIPDTFELTFDDAVPSDLGEITIFLNHNDVTGEMTVSGNKATATGETFKKYIKEGVNTFTAEGKHVFFVYDTQAPRPVFTAASASEGVNCQLLHAVKADENAPKARPDVTGLQQTLLGHVVDHSSTTAMTVSVKAQDGSEISSKAITLNDDGSFSEQVDCGYFFDVETEDSLGNKSITTFAAPGQNYEPSIGIQVNKSLFDFVLPVISDVMKSLGSSDLVDPEAPIFIPSCIDVPLFKRDCSIALKELSFPNDPNIIFELKDDENPDVESLGIRAGADFPELNFAATLTLSGGIPRINPIDMNITITNLLAAISPILSTDDQNALKLTLDDENPAEIKLDIKIEELSIPLIGNFDINLQEIANRIAQTVKTEVIKAINERVIPRLKTNLENAVIPNIPVAVVMQWDNEVKAKMSLDIAPSKLESMNGNARIELAGNVHADELGSTYRGTLGNLHLTDPLPELSAQTQDGKQYDLGIALPLNLLNQLFLSIHQTGLLQDFTLPFTFLGGLGAPFDAALTTAGVKKGDILNITIDSGAPLQVQLRKNDKNGLTDFVLYLDRFTFDIKYQPQAKDGESELPAQQTLMKATADLVVNLGLGVTKDNYIGLSVGKLISMNIASLESDFIRTELLPIEEANAAINDTLSILLLRADTLTGGISRVLENAIAQVVGRITGLQLDITVPDVGIVLRELGADDSNSHLLIALDLLNKAEIDAAKAAGEQLTFVLFLNEQNSSSSAQDSASDDSSNAQAQSTSQDQSTSHVSRIAAPRTVSGQGVVINPLSNEAINIGKSASISLQGENPTPEKGPLEYRYRINNDVWSEWKPRDSINFYKMDLGSHTLEVCARTAMLVEAKDCQTVKLNVNY